MRDSVNPPITRRGVLALAGAAALPVPLAMAAEPSVFRIAYPAAVATLDPAKFRVGGLEPPTRRRTAPDSASRTRHNIWMRDWPSWAGSQTSIFRRSI